jgi:uncharacterized 2Fe-2S/4Fe-4S cluster protein (DUF4445 family)
MIRVDFEPIGIRVDVEEGSTILEAARSAGIEIVSVCGGMGSCGRCRVQIANGLLSPLTGIEKEVLSDRELRTGRRLACQAVLLSAAKVHVPQDSLSTPQRLQLEGREGNRQVDPLFRTRDVILDAPGAEDFRSDVHRLEEYLEQKGIPGVQIPYPLLKTFSDDIRAYDWRFRVVLKGFEVSAVLPVGWNVLGLAVDIGTTKVAAYLVDLESGDTLAQQGVMNPQIHYGEDVMSRLFYCMEQENGRSILQALIIDSINNTIDNLCQQAGKKPEQIIEAVVVGNTVMHHLFAGLPVQQLGLMPFTPAISSPLEIPAQALGLKIASGANVYLPENIAGYVGADHVAVILATEVYRSEEHVIAVDVGTNTEISLVSDGRIFCCSCASGPAFEGAHIRNGMRAASGAIEHVQITAEAIRLSTIDGQLPIGICGSGILDAVGEMVNAGILDRRGRMSEASGFVHGTGKNRKIILVSAKQAGNGRDISIHWNDIHEIMLAKAAIRTGIEILLIEAGIQASQIDRIIVAGAFGTYLDIRNAIKIRMFPNLPLERFEQVGNAAGAGARQMLISARSRQCAHEFSGRMKYIDLTNHPNFKSLFLGSMDFRPEPALE